MTPLFRDDEQRRAVCDRLLEFSEFHTTESRFARPRFDDPARVRRARTLVDLALTLFDGDGHLAMEQFIVALDAETRGVIGDLFCELGIGNNAHVDRWLKTTEAFLVEPIPA